MTLNPLLDIKDLEQQKFVDDGEGNVAVRTSVVSDIEFATTVSSMNIVLVNANTEYPQPLIDNTKQLRFRARTPSDVRFAWVTGKVSAPIAPYSTLPVGMEFAGDAINFTSTTLYFASSTSGVIVELETFV